VYMLKCSYQENLGAAAARNRGMKESAADWFLFLDDDVVPDHALVERYSEAISNDADVVGFIGRTQFAPSDNTATNAVQLSDLTFMFGIARVSCTGFVDHGYGYAYKLALTLAYRCCLQTCAGTEYSQVGCDSQFDGETDLSTCTI
jgi:glycosyltransferase involved in cell wall biosynthesis